MSSSPSSNADRTPRMPARPLTGARAWIIADEKIGMQVQVRGVADALGLDYELKQVTPRGLTRLLAPWSRPGRAERFGAEGAQFAPPWPVIALATGRLSIPYLRAVARAAGPDTFTVVLQDPKTSVRTADLIWVPEHDRRRGANVMTTLTAPHSFSQERFARLRATVPAAIAALPRPRVTIVLGGGNGAYAYDGPSLERLGTALSSLAASGCAFLITPSRRSSPALIEAVEAATRAAPRILWDGTGDNPYPAFLAHADALIVTADSVNMTGEACATGRPVYVFKPTGGSAKFDRFHAALTSYGATRPLPDLLPALETWDYPPLDSGPQIAAEIERRWLARRQVLPGRWPQAATNDRDSRHPVGAIDGYLRPGTHVETPSGQKRNEPRRGDTMRHLNIAKLAATPVEAAPFDHVVVPGFLSPATVAAINATYPKIEKGGSYPIESLEGSMAIKDVIDELDGPEFEATVARLFDVDIAGRPKMYSLRGYTRAKDGQIHTDSKDKIVTVLLYLNEDWTQDGGRLRLLRNGRDVDDYVTEVPPDNGTLLIFKRSDTSWHGHHPFDGPRRSLQMNWMTSEGSKGFHAIRHKISATFKKMTTT